MIIDHREHKFISFSYIREQNTYGLKCENCSITYTDKFDPYFKWWYSMMTCSEQIIQDIIE